MKSSSPSDYYIANFRSLTYNNKVSFDIVLILIAFAALLAGLVGCVLPVLPGLPLAWAGLLIGKFSKLSDISVKSVVMCGIAALIISLLDTIAPAWFVKRAGGTKGGVWGSLIGLAVGFFLGPLFMIAGLFLGAFIGELICGNSGSGRALKAAWASFSGFLCSSGIKLLAVGIFAWLFIKSLF